MAFCDLWFLRYQKNGSELVNLILLLIAHVKMILLINNVDVWLILLSICAAVGGQNYLNNFGMSRLLSKVCKDSKTKEFKTFLV